MASSPNPSPRPILKRADSQRGTPRGARLSFHPDVAEASKDEPETVYCPGSLPPEDIPDYAEKQALLAKELSKKFPEAAGIPGVRYIRSVCKYKGVEYLSEGYSRPCVPEDFVRSPSPHFHYLPYKWTNGSIVLDAPEDYPRMFSSAGSSGPAVLAVMFECRKRPRHTRDIRKVLEKARFAEGRRVNPSDGNWAFVCGEADAVKYVAVEKFLCEVFMLETPADQAETLVSRPKCHVCRREFGYGTRCQACQRETCRECAPHQWRPNRWDLPDGDYAIRVYVRPRCDACLPFVKTS